MRPERGAPLEGESRTQTGAGGGANGALAEERQVVAWVYGQIREAEDLPVSAAEAVVRSLQLAVSQGGSRVLPRLRPGSFAEYLITHPVNVAILAMGLGERLGLAPADVRRLGLAGLLHDIGMVFVPDELLVRPGILSAAELERVKRHPVDGARVLLSSEPHLDLAAVVAYEHHITYEGGGYPAAVQAPAHFASRLVQVCDVYDALRSDRPSRPAWTHEQITTHLVDRAGFDFDPELVGPFLEMMESTELVAAGAG